MLKLFTFTAVLLGVVANTLPVQAQPMCNTRAHITALITEKYGEVSQGVGVQSKDQVVELYTSKITGSWTILGTRADGMSCVLAVGKNWIANPAFLTAFDEKVSYK